MDPLYLVDGTGYIFRAYHAIKPMRNMNGEPIHAVLGFTRMLLKLIKDHHPKALAVVFDAGGETFRKQIYAEYKANRQAQPEDLRPQVPRCFEAVDALGIRRIQLPGVEADDVLATLVVEAQRRGQQVIVVSGDKDLMQLVDVDVKVLRYNPRAETEELVDIPGVKEKFGVTPAQVVDVLALMGDASDNVPGVDGIGEKTAMELVATYGGVEEVLAAAPTMKPGKRRDTLLAQAEQARLSRALVVLKKDLELPLHPEDLGFSSVNVPTARAFFTLMGFKAMLNDPMFPASAAAPAGAMPAAMSTPPPSPAKPRTGQGEFNLDDTPPAPPVPADPAATSQETAEPPALLSMGTLSREHHTTITDAALLGPVLEQLERAGKVALHAVFAAGDPMSARLLGVAVGWAPGHAAFVPLRDETSLLRQGLPVALVLERLAPVLARSKVGGHDVKETLKVLVRHGLPAVPTAADSMLASYVLGVSEVHDLGHVVQRHLRANLTPLPTGSRGRSAAPLDELPPDVLAHHACEWVDASARALEVLEAGLHQDKLWDVYHGLELPLSDVLLRMEMAGVILQADTLRSLRQEMGLDMTRLEDEVHALAGMAFNLASPKQLADVLFNKLALPVGRKTKTGPSTDMDVLEELSLLHPLPAKVLEHRQLAKIVGTYLEALPALIHPQTGRIHTTYQQAVAATGRLSSQDPNLQNIPIRDERGRKIRSAFVAPPGKVLLSADYSQIELRILAHASQDPVLLAAFERGEDVHARTASEVLGIPLQDVTRDQRRAAKTINFGLLYGMSAFGLSQALHIPRAQAKEYLERYYARLSGVQQWQHEVLEAARQNGFVTTLFGRRRFLPGLTQKNSVVRQGAERMAINTPIQGAAADIIKRAMVALDARLTAEKVPARMILQVHDELVLEVDVDALEVVKPLVRDAMEHAASLAVKLDVDMGAGPNWGAAHG
jgi:DNA polymerase-1